MTKMSTTDGPASADSFAPPGPWTPTDAMVEWAYAAAAYTNAGEDPRVAFRRWLNMRLAAAWAQGHDDHCPNHWHDGPDCTNPYRSES